jgi:hypothetical protein
VCAVGTRLQLTPTEDWQPAWLGPLCDNMASDIRSLHGGRRGAALMCGDAPALRMCLSKLLPIPVPPAAGRRRAWRGPTLVPWRRPSKPQQTSGRPGGRL